MEGSGVAGIEAILETLQHACSQNPDLLKPAEQRLHSWETQRGFYTALMHIFSNRSMDVNIRWLAILYIKNGVDRYWRKNAPKAIPEEEKAVMKQQLISSLDEPVHQIATQVAVLVSKIARLELQIWPELFPALFEGVQNPSFLVKHRSLLVLNHVTKMLSSKRLATDRQLFRRLCILYSTFRICGYSDVEKRLTLSNESIIKEHSGIVQIQKWLIQNVITNWPQAFTSGQEEIIRLTALYLNMSQHCCVPQCPVHIKDIGNQLLSENIYGTILDLWEAHSTLCFERVHQQASIIEESLELSILLVKVLRKLTVHGHRGFTPDSKPMVFLSSSFDKIRLFLECRRQLSHNEKLIEMVEKIAKLLSKSLLDSLDHHPSSFIPLVQKSLEFCVTYLFNSEAAGLGFELFLVQCCNIIRSILRCDVYRPPKEIKDNTPQETIAVHQVKMSFFTPTVLTEIIQRLVMHFFLLRQEELENWESDPEDFVNEEVGESWRYQLRPSTEVLYLTLFAEFRSIVTPVVVNMIHTVQASPDSEDLNFLIQKDAVYTAAGLASYDLFGEVDFDAWFKDYLRREMHTTSSRTKLLRRRVPWLVGQWVNVKMSASVRPLLYESLIYLMQEHEDLVVRLTAANSLKTVVDDVEFHLDDFEPFINGSFTSLFHLLQQVTECDTKMHVLHVLSTLIERVDTKVRPFGGLLTMYLPHLWHESEQHNMLRCAILATLNHLIQGLGTESVSLYPFLLPIIQLSTDITQPPHVYLLEDGLELWQKTIENANKLTPELLHLFNNMPALLEISSENLRTCFGIIDRYLLLDGKEFLKNFGSSVVHSCENMVGNIKPEGGIIIAKVIETIVKSFPVEGAQLLQPVLIKMFKLIFEEEEHTPLLVIYLCIFGEIILKNPSYFSDFIEMMARMSNAQSVDLLGQFLDMCLDKLDSMTRLERRKLTVMALSSLLPVNSKCITDRFGVILDAVVDVLHEIHRCEEGVHTDCLVLFYGEDVPSDESETENQLRKKKLTLSDPVHRIPLWQFVGAKLKESRAAHGDVVFQSCMECLDSAVAEQLFSFINH